MTLTFDLFCGSYDFHQLVSHSDFEFKISHQDAKAQLLDNLKLYTFDLP